jgi:hypothetical protein
VIRRPTVVLLAVVPLLLASCAAGSSTSARHIPTSAVATPAEQADALRATSTFRALEATAGQELASDVTALDAAVHASDMAGATAAVGQAILVDDRVRSYAASDGSGQAGATPIDEAHLAAVLADLRAGEMPTGLCDQMAASAPVLEVLLSRVILDPSTVALRAQDIVAWVALVAPTAYGASPTPTGSSPADVESAVTMAASAVEGLEPLGTIVAPAATRATGRDLARLEAVLAASPTPREVVAAADASLAALGELAGDLGGFGRGGEYQ